MHELIGDEMRRLPFDDIGNELAPMAGGRSVVWDDWVKSVLQVLGDRVKVVVDTREHRDAVR